jgi:hypothetical protein
MDKVLLWMVMYDISAGCGGIFRDTAVKISSRLVYHYPDIRCKQVLGTPPLFDEKTCVRHLLPGALCFVLTPSIHRRTPKDAMFIEDSINSPEKMR